MPDLSALSGVTTKATALSNLILVTPQSQVGYGPQNPPNADGTVSQRRPPPSLMFHYEGEQTVTIESDITDHYAENNSAIEDQIALKPEVITTHGFIGELNDIVPALLKPLKFVADKLTAIGSYQPSLSATALIAYSQAFFLYQVAARAAESAVSTWSGIGNFLSGSNGQNVIDSQGLAGFDFQTGRVTGVQNKQQTMFQQFYGYWRERTLFTVQTPWAVFTNMAIKSLRAIQDAETNVITDFEVSFKMIRYASTVQRNGFDVSFSGRAASQAANLTNLGTSSGSGDTSLATSIANMG